jgi:ElaB/YqjD/DUF883 family membrane-anchored ribosome-binding protein
MATKTQVVSDRLIKDFKAVMHDAEELLKATASQTGDKIGAVRARAEESLQEARRKLDEVESDLVDRTKAAAKATDELVHENPWQAVAIATAVGFLLGMLTGRR